MQGALSSLGSGLSRSCLGLLPNRENARWRPRGPGSETPSHPSWEGHGGGPGWGCLRSEGLAVGGAGDASLACAPAAAVLMVLALSP